MKDSKKVTISAISTALSVVLLLIGTYFSILDLSCLFMCSIIIMLPLYKKTITGAFLSYLATSILSAIFAISKFYYIILPYFVFFGLHPIINELELTKKWKKWIVLPLKTLWFVGVILLLYKFADDFFIGFDQRFKKYVYYVLIFGGAVFFVIYDFVMIYFRKSIEKILYRIGL